MVFRVIAHSKSHHTYVQQAKNASKTYKSGSKTLKKKARAKSKRSKAKKAKALSAWQRCVASKKGQKLTTKQIKNYYVDKEKSLHGIGRCFKTIAQKKKYLERVRKQHLKEIKSVKKIPVKKNKVF